MDGNTNPIRTIKMDGNHILWAFFDKNDANAVENIPIRDTSSKQIINGYLYIIRDNQIFNVLGQLTTF